MPVKCTHSQTETERERKHLVWRAVKPMYIVLKFTLGSRPAIVSLLHQTPELSQWSIAE